MANTANDVFLKRLLEQLEKQGVHDQTLDSLESKLCGRGVMIPTFFKDVIQHYLESCIDDGEIDRFINRLNNTITPWPLRAFDMAFELIDKQERAAGKTNAGFEVDGTLREQIALNPYMTEAVIDFLNSTPVGHRSDFLHLLTVLDAAVIKGFTHGLTRAQAETDHLLKDATIEESDAILAYIDFVKGSHEAVLTPEQLNQIVANITAATFDVVHNIEIISRISTSQIWALSFGFTSEEVRDQDYGFEHPYMAKFAKNFLQNNPVEQPQEALEQIRQYYVAIGRLTDAIINGDNDLENKRDAIAELIASVYPNAHIANNVQFNQAYINASQQVLHNLNNSQIRALSLPNVTLAHVTDLSFGLNKIHNVTNLRRYIDQSLNDEIITERATITDGPHNTDEAHNIGGTNITNHRTSPNGVNITEFKKHIFYRWYHTLSDQRKEILNNYVGHITNAAAVEDDLWDTSQIQCPVVDNDDLVDFIGYLLTNNRHDTLANIADYSGFNKYQLRAIQGGYDYDDIVNIRLNEHQLSALQLGFTFAQIGNPAYGLDQPVIHRFLQANPAQTQTAEGRQQLLQRITGAQQLFAQAIQNFDRNKADLFTLILAIKGQPLGDVGPDQLFFGNNDHINFERLRNQLTGQWFDITLIENAHNMAENIDLPTAGMTIEAIEYLLDQMRDGVNHRIHEMPAQQFFNHYVNFQNNEQRTLFIDLPNLPIENLNEQAVAALTTFNTRQYIHGPIKNIMHVLQRVTIDNDIVLSDQLTEPRSLDETIIWFQQLEPEILEFLASHENVNLQHAEAIYNRYCRDDIIDDDAKSQFAEHIPKIIRRNASNNPNLIDVILNMPAITTEQQIDDTIRIIEMLKAAPNLQIDDIRYLRENNTILHRGIGFVIYQNSILHVVKQQLLEPVASGNLFNFATFTDAVDHLAEQSILTLMMYQLKIDLLKNCPHLTSEQIDRTFNLSEDHGTRESAKWLIENIYNNIHSDELNRFSFASIDQALDTLEAIFEQFTVGADIPGYGVIATELQVNTLKTELIDAINNTPQITNLDGDLLSNLLKFNYRFHHRQRGEFQPLHNQLAELAPYQLKGYILGLTYDNCALDQHNWNNPEVAQASIVYLEQEAEQAEQQGLEFNCNNAFENIRGLGADQILLLLPVQGEEHEHAVQHEHEFHNV